MNDRNQTSKTFNYLDASFVIPYFALFIAIWVYLRHYVNLVIIHSILTTFETVGPFELNWETQQYKCSLSQYIAFGLLGCLQSINIFWLYFILRVAYNIVLKKSSQDVRSDDEDTDAEIEVKEGEGYEVGVSGGTAGEKKTLGNGKVYGMNGKASGGYGTKPEAVLEGKKVK